MGGSGRERNEALPLPQLTDAQARKSWSAMTWLCRSRASATSFAVTEATGFGTFLKRMRAVATEVTVVTEVTVETEVRLTHDS